MTIFTTLGSIINNAYIMFCFALGIWAALLALRSQPISGNFWGAMWSCTILAVIGLLVWLGRVASGEELRAVYFLYQLYFIIVFPGTFALMRGRDDRGAAMYLSGIALFTAFAAISAADPTRHVIAPTILTPLMH